MLRGTEMALVPYCSLIDLDIVGILTKVKYLNFRMILTDLKKSNILPFLRIFSANVFFLFTFFNVTNTKYWRMVVMLKLHSH
jgi:hypothetical protein